MKVIRILENYVVKIETIFLVASLIVMVMLAFLQVVLRNVFSSGLLWADTFLRYLVVWVGFIGAAIATQEERHISVEVLTKFISPLYQNIISFVTSFIAAIVCYYLFISSMQFMEIGLPADVKVFGNIPLSYFMMIIPIGYLLMIFHFAVRALIKVENIIKRKETHVGGNA
jgi:TRAP-type C4-dicarboxylate transport system permease small subunit